MTINPINRAHHVVGTADTSEIVNDQIYGRRMQLLLKAGASRYLDVDSDSLIAAAMSNQSDEDMVDRFIGAVDQVKFNEMKVRFEALPEQLQEAEFLALPAVTQKHLRGAGYKLPVEKPEKGLLERIFTWDIPLLPEEHFGSAVKWGFAPIRAMGFVAGQVASNVWENAVMRPSRFATRLGRSAAYMAEKSSAGFNDAFKWKEAWDAAKFDDGSYYKSATKASIDKIGSEATDLLKIFLRDGLQGVYDFIEQVGIENGWDNQQILNSYTNWYERLADEDMVEAMQILESGQLTIADASVKAYNKVPYAPDVRPGTAPATAIGLVGSLAVEILLDPMTWVGGFYVKGMKAMRPAIRAGDTEKTIDMWRNICAIEMQEKGMARTVKMREQMKEVNDWYGQGGFKVWAATKLSTRSNAKAINRMIERCNEVFEEIDAIDKFKLALKEDNPLITQYEINEAVIAQFGRTQKADMLIRDVPAISAIWDDMLSWHRFRRDEYIVEVNGQLVRRTPHSGPIADNEKIIDMVDEAGVLVPAKPANTLSTWEGYWDFLAGQEGWNALASKLGGVDPESMFLPRIGAFGSQWIKGKRWVRDVVDFDNFPEAGRADLARMTAQFLARQSDYIHGQIWKDIQSGAIATSKNATLDEDVLRRILDDPTVETIQEFGLTETDLINIERARETYQANAAQIILEDGQLDELLNWYQSNGYEITHDGILKLKADFSKPFSGANRAKENYINKRLHSPASNNAEITELKRLGILAEAEIRRLAYYPARLAEKLTTYTPTKNFLDVTDADTAISEFTKLIDMGIMAGMSRSKIDGYLRAFMIGGESERWLVQNEFFMDFLGRSGALLAGGRDVQEFIQRFIRHGHQRYANLADTPVGPANIQRAIIPGRAHEGHLSVANVIPNYRELAAVSKYMSMYRKIGWGMWLPKIDKFMARAWRPAVLLRLGYVARNGGEELMSWWWREGPKHWAAQKTAKTSVGRYVTWDEYGRKIFKELPPEEQIPFVLKPAMRLWRSFNELAGVGDYAITRKAMLQSVKENPNWRFITDEQREALFKTTRDAIRTEADKGISGFARMSFDLGEATAQRLSSLLHSAGKAYGMPTKQGIAKWIGKRLDSDHEARVKVVQMSMTNPTILDSQMRDILGTFDSYIAADKVNMDSLLRQTGFGAGQNFQLPMNYGQSELKRLSNLGPSDLHTDKSLGVAQQLSYYADDPAHVAALAELALYSSPTQEETFRILNEALGLPATEGTHAGVAYRYFKENHSDALRNLREAFDTKSIHDLKTVEDVDDAIKQITAIEEFVEAMPEEIQDVIRKFLEPSPGVGQSLNPIAFLLSDIDSARVTTNWTHAREQAKVAFVNAMMTPEGQQLLYSTHRSNMGFDRLGGVISSPLPPGYTRLFVPIISVDHVDALADILTTGSLGANDFFNELVRRLEIEFQKVGIPASEASKAMRMLQPSLHPSTMHHTPNSYRSLAQSYVAQDSNWMPLAVVSSNDQVAHSISKVMDDMLRTTDTQTSMRGRIGSFDVNSEELFNEPGAAIRGRKNLNVPSFSYEHGGTLNESVYQNLGYAGNVDLQNNFYGWGQVAPGDFRAIPAVDFGSRGLRDETVIGAPLHMLFAKPENIRPVQMLDNTPVTHRVKVYRNKADGRTAVFRESDDVTKYDWYNDAEWEVIDQQIVTQNDLRNAAEELALINIVEIEDMVTTGIRSLPGEEVQVFHPWIREVQNAAKGGEISQTRINDHAVRDGWWEHAPRSVLTLLPATDQMGSKAENIGKAWNTLLRNWFDGVVNPMIGAMVREPLFQHYLLKGFEQTRGVRRLYHHSTGRYDKLSEALGGAARFDDDGQLIIDALEDFLQIEWAGASVDPEEAISQVFFAIEGRNSKRFVKNLEEVLTTADIPADKKNVLKILNRLAKRKDQKAINEFYDYALRSRNMFEAHRDVALKRAMTLTGAFIDDHRIRSQFQEMVGTMIPFWFAEDQFLRRLGRSINHNPLMLRNLHLTMNAGVYGGLIQEDQYGEKRLVIPGTEVATNYLMELSNEYPIIDRLFGGPIGAVAKASLSNGVSMNINVIPGYNLENMGQMGFGPLAAIPINLASHRDPSIRQFYDKHMVGGRYQGPSAQFENPAEAMTNVVRTMWESVVPAVIARPLAMMGWDGGAGRTKATRDVINFMAMNDMIPDERDIASLENPNLFSEQFMDKVNTMAMQYQLLQALTWFALPSTAVLADLTQHPNFEWNEEFHALTDQGVPYEKAYEIWVKNIEAREGEFNPIEHSPFKVGKSSKIPFAVLETTQLANEWLVANEGFARDFKSASAYFMPRKFDVEDTEYVAEAKQRQLNMGLASLRTSEEFLTELYKNAAYHTYHEASIAYKTKKYAAKAYGMDTASLDLKWDAWYEGFQQRHPVLTSALNSSTSKERRESTIQEFRLLVENPDIVPEGLHREDVLKTMEVIVEFNDKLESYSGVQGTTATDIRNALKLQYWRYLEKIIRGRPWLNELYYSVFLPMLSDSWMAKYEAGLIKINPIVLAA